MENDSRRFRLIRLKRYSIEIHQFHLNQSNEVSSIVEDELVAEMMKFDQEFVHYDKVLMIEYFQGELIDKEHQIEFLK